MLSLNPESNAEKGVFNTYFEVKVPADLVPSTVTVGIVTPRKDDTLLFTDLDREDNSNPRGNLVLGKRVGARLEEQKNGDFIAINYQGVVRGQNAISSRLSAFTFTEEFGWKPLEGAIAFRVKE